MYTGNVWGIALIVGGFLAALIGYQLVLSAAFPAWAEKSVRALQQRTMRTVLAGLGVTVGLTGATALAVAIFAQLGPFGAIVNVLLLAAVSVPLGLAFAAVSGFLGHRMPSPVDDGSPWRATLRGGVVTALAFALPVIGWFVVLPAVIATGLGAVTLGLFAKDPAAQTVAVAAPIPEGAAA